MKYLPEKDNNRVRFKKLELLGFKSFGEPTELIFEPGITAVVGPNGCGKSNVADAIKWVLGEQSARELRGGRMEDLIFNGSDQREPIGYAEVSLTLDNSDKALPLEYEDVVISRRLFRTGESFYLLNGNPVRLKDIQELLMGTGIGTSAYSLFEQGRIEQIISARPEDRRAVFEEAAGITKFKSQKREALRKLDETEANLLRVNDVIAEVKRQIQALERQVRRAKTYQEQFDGLKTLEVRLARHDLGQITSHVRMKEAALNELRRQIAELETQLNSQESQLQEVRNAVAQADQALTRAREQMLSITHNQETIRHRLEVTRERITEAEARGAQVLKEVDGADQQVGRLKEQLASLVALVAQADAERRGKEQEVAKAQARLAESARVIEESQEGIATAQDDLMAVTNSQVHLKNDLHQVQQETTHLEARHNRLQMEGTKVAAERSEADAQLKNLEISLAQAKKALETVLQEKRSREEALTATETALAQAQQKVGGLEQESTKVGSQLDLLKGLLASHEGYSSGVKALLTALDRGQLSREGVGGVLAELIQVKETETAAMDAALGPWAEAVVVESASVAERCRQFLKETRAGRVLFLIRDQVPDSNGTAAREVPSAVSLLDKVGITPHMEPLLKLVLADTWLIPDWETARNFLSQMKPSAISAARFVTPAGELFSVVSALMGEIPTSQEGLVVGRKSRMELLEVSLSHLQRQLEQAKVEMAALDADRQEKAHAVAALDSTFQERNQELHRVEAAYSSAKTLLEKLYKEESLLKVEQAEVEQELAEINSRLNERKKELQEKDEEIGRWQATIQQAQERIAAAGRDREEASVVLATVRTELSSFDQVVASRRASLSVLEQSIQTAESQVTSFREEMKRLQASQEQWEAACGELEGSLRELESQEIGAAARVTQEEGRKAAALQAAQAQERQWMVFGRQLEGFQSKVHTQEMEQVQLNFQQEQIMNRLTQVYQVNLGPSEEEPSQIFPDAGEESLESVRSKIADLSQKLQRMGPVNLASIDEERELQNRYEYLVTQQNDLLKAKDDLHQVITKINRTTRAMFRETFEAIQKEFQITFKQLFGGGEARLILMDEEDVLESGIEIIARPPGKPLQAISLLSGGEKALTTIALLFAIFRVKPSPFCLLDEIDAPLDESNVERFTRALKGFLKESQFIIITHNKKTISMADVMYGITMEQSGVSRIVSVKFKKREEETSQVSSSVGPPENGSAASS